MTLVKVFVVPNRHRDDIGSLSVVTKSVVVCLTKHFHDNLEVDDKYSSFESESHYHNYI